MDKQLTLIRTMMLSLQSLQACRIVSLANLITLEILSLREHSRADSAFNPHSIVDENLWYHGSENRVSIQEGYYCGTIISLSKHAN